MKKIAQNVAQRFAKRHFSQYFLGENMLNILTLAPDDLHRTRAQAKVTAKPTDTRNWR
jgi:hypothetical protein